MNKTLKRVLQCVFATTMTLGFSLSGVGCGDKLLKDAYAGYFKTGAMVAITPTADLKLGYEDSVLKEFNSFTAENEMKWTYDRTHTVTLNGVSHKEQVTETIVLTR